MTSDYNYHTSKDELVKPFAARSRPVGIVFVTLIWGACAPAGAPPAEGPAPAVAPAAVESGLLPLRYDAATGKVHLTIPRLGERLLYLNTLATGVGATAAGLDWCSSTAAFTTGSRVVVPLAA